MSETFIYMAMINAMTNAFPSAVVAIDSEMNISQIYISKRPAQKLKYIVGHKFYKLLRCLFDAQTADTINTAYLQCINTRQTCQIPKMAYINVHNLTEYFNWIFLYLPENDNVIACIKNITENVLLEEEFLSMSEQYESVNRELCVAMSNLDFHLMDIEQAQKKIAALFRITSVVQKTVNVQEVLNEILDGITRELGFNDVSILLLDEEKQELAVMAYRGRQDYATHIPLGKGITGYAAVQRELIYVEDVNEDPRYISAGNTSCVSEVAIPLIVDDKVLGVLNVETTSERVLQPYDLNLLRSLGSQIAMTIAHASYVAKVEKQAITDGLTGLYNYRYFRAMLEQEFKRAIRYNRPLTMLMIDIDYFKHYNDTNGHRMGDEVLSVVAALLKQACRDVDFLVRYGGEEFAVLLPETSIDEAYVVAERMRSSIADYPFPNSHSQPGGKLTVSIGISGFPGDAHSNVELVDYADAALYSAKRLSRNRICFYNSKILS